MNQEQAKAWLPLIQAVAEGKTLQLKAFKWVEGQLVVDWVETYGDVDFQTSPSRWRIKPEPKKAWFRVCLWKQGILIFLSKKDIEREYETDKDFVRWLTDRIEYELPEVEA